MKMRKLSVLLTIAIILVVFAACGQDDSGGAGAAPVVTLEVMTNMTGEANEAFIEAIRLFTEETGIRVDYAAPAADYEALMRTRMATDDLPDVFSTHGWAVLRYGEFLRPLNDRPWFGQVSPMIRDIITDANGNLLVLPVDIDLAGMNFNRDILARVGWAVEDIRTWNDFEIVLELVRDAGYIPIMVGGLDDWTLGQIGDWIPPSMFITYENNNHRQAFLDGTFDWEYWGIFYDKISDWHRRGFFNEDALTANYDTVTTYLGRGEVAFTFFGNYAAIDAAARGPANIGMMPIPAFFPGDEPTFIAGERLAVGVSHNTAHPEEALMFIDFLARPDIMIMLAEANGNMAGFTGVQTDLGFLTPDFEKWSHIRSFPYFDRVYLPSGGWDVLCDNVFGILNGTFSRDDAIDHMRRSINELLGN